eukprot:gnl/TRDRNA2_/TRDRNA2_207858_c0_seq1.p1 gnl/TRDRNA2_/TRDRNA2_207858_c0~~gnl/TRDRNA2_/TRDRNA2_207858_c0_seq1.p1  ORF type:complete len:127 (-),score=14.14 gnl/TRDRNA2_/TRDRNA2_207858_c0_seq1:24-404(-)
MMRFRLQRHTKQARPNCPRKAQSCNEFDSSSKGHVVEVPICELFIPFPKSRLMHKVFSLLTFHEQRFAAKLRLRLVHMSEMVEQTPRIIGTFMMRQSPQHNSDRISTELSNMLATRSCQGHEQLTI